MEAKVFNPLRAEFKITPKIKEKKLKSQLIQHV